MNIGIIGLDSSHCVAFSKILIQAYSQHSIVGAWPGGSEHIPPIRDRLEGFTCVIQSLGIPLFRRIARPQLVVNRFRKFASRLRDHKAPGTIANVALFVFAYRPSALSATILPVP